MFVGKPRWRWVGGASCVCLCTLKANQMGLFSFLSSKPVSSGGYTSKSYKLKGKSIVVKVKNAEPDGSKVSIALFNPTVQTSLGYEVTSSQSSSTQDFFNDVTAIVDFMNREDALSKQNSFNALRSVCTDHIKKFGRLIDNDLDAYLYSLMHVMDAVNIADIGSHTKQADGHAFFSEMKQACFQVFKNYIWVNKYNPFSPNPFDKFDLVKLTDL
jgi:hypothetical protein